MSLTSVGIYEFNAKDLIGHGAFAVVYKGRLKSVSEPFLLDPVKAFIHGNMFPSPPYWCFFISSDLEAI